MPYLRMIWVNPKPPLTTCGKPRLTVVPKVTPQIPTVYCEPREFWDYLNNFQYLPEKEDGQ